MQIREAFTLENRNAQFFLGHQLIFIYLVICSKVAIAANDSQFEIPGIKHVDMFIQVQSQPADIQIIKYILLNDAGTPDSCNYYSEMTFGR